MKRTFLFTASCFFCLCMLYALQHTPHTHLYSISFSNCSLSRRCPPCVGQVGGGSVWEEDIQPHRAACMALHTSAWPTLDACVVRDGCIAELQLLTHWLTHLLICLNGACLWCDYEDYDAIFLYQWWKRERGRERKRVHRETKPALHLLCVFP